MLKQKHFFFAPYQFADPKYESKWTRQWCEKRLTDALPLFHQFVFQPLLGFYVSLASPETVSSLRSEYQ